MAQPVGVLEIQMRAGIARLQKDMTDAKSIVSGAVQKMNSLLGALGAGISVGFAASIVKNAIDAADSMRDLSLNTGMAYKELAAFKLLADKSGGSVEEVAKAAKFMSIYMVENSDKLKSLGVTADNAYEALKQFADVIKDIEDPALRTALATEVLKRGGADMVKMLAGGSEAFAEAETRTAAYASVLESLAPQADTFNDTMKEIGLEASLMAANLADRLLPTLNELAKEFNAAAEGGDGFKSAMHDLADGLVAIMNQLDNLVIIARLVGNAFKAVVEQSALLKLGLFKEAGQIGAEFEKYADGLVMQYDRVSRAAEKARAEAKSQAGFVGPPETLSLQNSKRAQDVAAAARAIVTPTTEAAKATKLAADAAQKFVEALKKEAETLGMSAEEKRIYEVESMKLSPELKKQAAAWIVLAEAKRLEIEMTRQEEQAMQDQQRTRDQRIASLQQEIEALRQQAEAYGKTAFEIAEMNEAKAAAALGAVAPGTDPQTIAMLQLELMLRREIKLAIVDITIAAQELANVQDRNEALSQSAQGMAMSFGTVGRAIGDMATALARYADVQDATAKETIQNERLLAEAKKKGSAEQIAKAEANARASAVKQMQAELRMYGDMAGAAKSFFKEKTAAYKLLEATEKAFRLLEFALSVKAMAQHAAETSAHVANSATQTGASVVAGAAKFFAQSGWAGFIGVAAMVAILAALGWRGGSGGGSGVANVSQDRQDAAGTGSVLGDSTAKTQSLENAIRLLSENSVESLQFYDAVLEELKGVRRGIEGLAAALLQQISAGTSWLAIDPSLMALGEQGDALGFSSATRELVDFGITFEKQTLKNIEAQGLLGETYAAVAVTTSKLWGLVKDQRIEEMRGKLDESIANQFAMILLDMRDAIVKAGEVLGIFGNDLSDFVVDLGYVSLKGLKGKELQEQLEAIFGKVGDDMAKALFPAVTEFQKAGEGAMETLMRLAKDYQAVDQVMKMLGKTFGLVGMASIAARERLIELSGGLDEFIKQAQDYADLFLRPAEQAAPILNAVLAELSRLGLSGVLTMDAFKALVASIDTTTEAGAALYAALMKLAPAFAAAVDAVHDTVKAYFDIILEAQQFQFRMQQAIAALSGGGGGTASLWAQAQTLITLFNQPTTTLQDKIDILNQLAGLVGQYVQQRQAEIEAQKSAVQEAADARIDAMTKEMNLARQWVGILNTAKQMLDQMKYSSSNPLPTSGRLNLASLEVARLQQQLASAAPEERAAVAQKLLEALQRQLTLAQEFYQRPSPEYQAIYNDIIRQITAIEDEAQANSDRAEQLQREIAALQEATVAELKAIDQQMEAVKQQAAEWYAEIAAIGAQVYEGLRKQAEEDVLALAEAAGVRKEIRDILKEINAKLGVPPPGHADGLAYVPYDNYTARLHKGERVLTADEARSYGSGITISMPMTFNGSTKEDAAAIRDAVDKRVMEILPAVKQKLKRA